MMRLTTVGTGTISLSPSRACAGHLIEAGAIRLLLDCGPGVAHRLAEYGLDWWGITHVAFTHFHLDHVADFAPLVFAWRYARVAPRSDPLTVIGPPGTRDMLTRQSHAHGAFVLEPGFPVQIIEIELNTAIELGDGVRMSACPVPHTAESVAYSIERGGRRVVYTGDTGFDLALARWAHKCDVLLVECSLPARMRVASHLTPEECAELARQAAPRHLVLTHLYPPLDDENVQQAVSAHFAGPVTVATDGWSLDIEEDQ